MLLPLAGDLCALALTSCYALGLLRLFEETAKRGVFKQMLNRKLLHITFGLGFMLFWPLFSSGIQGAAMAALVPGVNIVEVLLIGLGVVKDEATVKSMSRFGDYRELIKGPMYYAITITLCCAIYWRTSPVAIAGICNLCAGDGNPSSFLLMGLFLSLLVYVYIQYNTGIADIIGRRFGKKKIPYNKDKSFAGSIAMATAGFTVSVGYSFILPSPPPTTFTIRVMMVGYMYRYMYYFSMFGYVRTSFKMVLGFLVVSLVSALVESHPICAKLDDNLLVPLASVLLGTLVFA
ncbi:putative phytol/farnesol kinase [Helianthus annuus]|nr:putative phytol/farnesol kinase [Helianthus annuus]